MVDMEPLLRYHHVEAAFASLAADNDEYSYWHYLRVNCFCRTEDCIPCSVRDCPHCEPNHYHHDGCPACHPETRKE